MTGSGAMQIADAVQHVKGINTLVITNEGISSVTRETIISKLESSVSSLEI